MTTQTKTTETKATRSKMDTVCKGLETKSAKIRALAAAGYTRSETAKYLGIRYQHVRNVLITPIKGDKK